MAGLNDATRLQVYDALFAYIKDGSICDLPPSGQAVFEVIRPKVDSNSQKLVQITIMAKAYLKTKQGKKSKTTIKNEQTDERATTEP